MNRNKETRNSLELPGNSITRTSKREFLLVIMLVAHARRARSAAAFAREAKRSERVHHSYVEGGTDPGDIDHPIQQRHVYISIKSHEGEEMEKEGAEAEN